MAVFGKSIMDNLDDTKPSMDLDSAYEGVASSEYDDDMSEDFIDRACYAFESADIDDDDDYYDDVNDDVTTEDLEDEDYDDCEDDDDYDDIIDGNDDGSDDIMDDSVIEAATRELDETLRMVEATESLIDEGLLSNDEAIDIAESMAAIESLTAELSDGSLITNKDIESNDESFEDDDDENSTKNPKDEYDFDADGTEDDDDDIDYGEDDDDDLSDLVDDDF